MLDEISAHEFIEEAKARGSRPGLQSILSLLEELSNPQNSQPVIQVVGTNGKGSVCAYMESAFTDCGYRVGVYTSPAVFCEFERYRIAKEMITEEKYLECLSQVYDGVEIMRAKGKTLPTIFEIETALAFLYFKKSNVDLIIAEAGMGGELDATNVFETQLAVVFTPIGMDHMQFLGSDVTTIAKTKAGILKKNALAVAAGNDENVTKVLVDVARQKNCHIQFVSQKEGEFFHLTMKGDYQKQNAALAFNTLLALKERDTQKFSSLNESFMIRAIEKTIWPGRLEKVADSPDIYLDGAHNVMAMGALAKEIKQFFAKKNIIYIIGVFEDKEYDKMFSLVLPYASVVYTITPDHPRALNSVKLKEELTNISCSHCNIFAKENLNLALKDALRCVQEKNWKPDDTIILCFGSLSFLKKKKKEINKIYEI